jgi:hypothetical protein
MSTPIFSVNTAGTVERVARQLAATPQALDRARLRALRKLLTWVQRQVLRAASEASGATQKALKAMMRYQVTTQGNGAIRIWIGTNDIGAHNLGTVRWTRRMQGARVGKALYYGAWSWSPRTPPILTQGLVMQRNRVWRRASKGTYAGKRREMIEKVMVEIHELVSWRIQKLLPEIADRFERLFTQELRYALNLEAVA